MISLSPPHHLAADLAGLAGRIGQDLRLLLALASARAPDISTPSARNLAACALKSLRIRHEHRIAHLLRQVDLGDAHIDQVAAQPAGGGPGIFHHGIRNLLVRRDDLLQRAASPRSMLSLMTSPRARVFISSVPLVDS